MKQQRIMYIFPGQGSQYKSMGSDIYQEFSAARRIYDEASAVLGYDMAELSFNDPHDQINLTRFTQPALLTHSLACLEVLKELTDNRLTPHLAAGHSLGEYSALVATEALSFQEALRLVQKRGELMGAHGEGEMLAFPLELDKVRPLAEKHYCTIAACNLRDQTVVGGRSSDLDALTQDATENFPRKRPVRLQTEGAFHTYYMVNAAQHFRAVLDEADLAPPTVQVLSNYTGDYHEADPTIIKSRLFFQLFHPVLWINNLQTALQDGVTLFIELGGGIGSGDTPSAKRPNLEGVIKKAMRGTDHQIPYLSAINSETLGATADALHKLE
jgi:[acyl-carrier-protein] S-malonyltransferase